jgi:hypothetical protein
MKKILLLACLALGVLACKSTEKSSAKAVPQVAVTAALDTPKQFKFPDDWYGEYKGELEIWSGRGKIQSLPMELIIAPTDTLGLYRWVIIYHQNGTPMPRDYRLKTIDASKGEYLTDEQNSIYMHAYLMGNKMYERFMVMGNDLMATHELLPGGMIQTEIIVSSSDSLSVTGGTSEDVPPVYDYRIMATQRALLKRVK